MNVTLIHYAVPPVVGGVESVLGHHARLMARAGHQVQVVAGRGDRFHPQVSFVHLPLVDSRHPDVLSVKAELDQGRTPPEFETLVASLLAALEPVLEREDVLIAHNVCSLNKNLPLTAALERLSRQNRKPRLVLWHHDLAWTTPRYRAELHDGYPWDLLRTDWPEAIQVVVSELRRGELAALLEVGRERIAVIPNGFDLAGFLGLPEQTLAFVRRLHLLEAEPLLLLPVRLTPRKNLELALQVMAALKPDFPRARLVITGPLGPHNPANLAYFDRLKALREALGLHPTVHFLAELSQDYLPDEVIAGFYRLADALFLPSREEGFGLPILEAGLSGLPIFCAGIQPLRELAGEQATYFSPDGEPAAIAAQIRERLSANPVYQLRLRLRSRYTWEQIYASQIGPLLDRVERSSP